MNVLLSAQKALIFRTHSGVLLLFSFHPMTQKYQLPVLMIKVLVKGIYIIS